MGETDYTSGDKERETFDKSCADKDTSSLFDARVLIADDESGNQKLTRLQLRRLGLHVTAVDDGQQVIDIAMSETFDMIFMDMQMPVLDGFKATTHLRRMGLNIPIIALTAYAFDEDRERCIDAGCDDYIPKPVDPELMRRIVQKHCQRLTKAK